MNYTLSSGFRVDNVIDHLTRVPTDEQYRQAFGNGEMILESVSLEEIEATHLYDLDGNGYSAFMDAIITTKNRVERTMAAFGRELNLAMNGSGLEAAKAEIGDPRKSGDIAIMAARFPLSDGQSISVIFHSPSGNPGKIANDDMLVAFRFLLNKRDVTHVVAPSGGRDISLKQTTLALSNLAERNSAKFQAQQDANKAKEAELTTLQADTAQLQAQAEDLGGKVDVLAEQVSTTTAERDRVAKLLEQQKQRNDELRQKLAGLQPRQVATPEPTIDGADDKTVIPSSAKDELMTRANRPQTLGVTIPGIEIVKTTDRVIDVVHGSKTTRYTWDGTGYKYRGMYLLTDGREISAEALPGADLKDNRTYDAALANKLAADLKTMDSTLYQKVLSDISTISGIDDGTLVGYERALFVSSLANALQSAAKADPAKVSLALQFIKAMQNKFTKPIFSDRHKVWALMQTEPATTAAEPPQTDPRRAEWDAKLDGMTDLELMRLGEAHGSVGSMSGDSLRAYLKSVPVEELDAAEAKLATSAATTEQKPLFWYGLRSRPYSMNAQPAGVAEYIEPARVLNDPRLAELLVWRDPSDVRHGAIGYTEKLSDAKVKGFELVDLSAQVWTALTRARAINELMGTVTDMLAAEETRDSIWERLFKPNGELVATNNPFFNQETGKYDSNQLVTALQDAGYSGSVRAMVDAFIVRAQDARSNRDDYLPSRPSQADAARQGNELSAAALDALQAFTKGHSAPEGWEMEVDEQWGTLDAMIGVSITRPALQLKLLTSTDWEDGYIVTPYIEDERGITNGQMDVYYGEGSPIPGVVSVSTWDELLNVIQTDQARQAAKQTNPEDTVTTIEPGTTAAADPATSNQWDETDPVVLEALQSLEALRKNETDIDAYMAAMEKAFKVIEDAGALDRHEPYMHTVADRLTELMEAEGV